MKVLVISTVWVEPTSSAAGSRMLQILRIFLDRGWELTYCSTAAVSEFAFNLESIGVHTQKVQVNDASFDAFAKAYHPNIVLFDRFVSEEQFGWRVTEGCPKALKILDTEDLHCLRKAREMSVKNSRLLSANDLVSDIAKREIASIYRCDMTLIISRYEIHLLETFYKVPKTLLLYVPFLLSKLKNDFKAYEERENFISIGNFLHAPNWDAVLQLKNLWSSIRKKIPDAALHVYGAYPSNKVMELHNPKEGFIIMGRARDAKEVLRNARVLLAPLRFGAGLKGKFIDAMQCGTPSVTTAIGAEGMTDNAMWCGAIEIINEDFINAAVDLYKTKSSWVEAQKNGVTIINTHFQKSTFKKRLIDHIEERLINLKKSRLENFTGQMLLYHSMRSTKFMSKWIEEKNK